MATVLKVHSVAGPFSAFPEIDYKAENKTSDG